MGGQLQVTPGTLSGHGGGCESLADKFGQLAQLLEQARTDDQCFGPVGNAIGISDRYFETLQGCQETARKARQFLMETKQALEDTIKDYDETERKIIEVLNKAGEGLAG
ncbi:hypothetical protein GCM10011581_45980 [Saccharopolyspora subtropica]|uniref:Excreted virulence factor EspC (Type VII ESX diderm) n=1 Tax=Saccharopolyspora thermophila TaxID=89367 RepID=A0A917NIU4_9PSEU|nr:hypothetical protein [Saccharopolyspora subtropica]GGJ03734.1 hypothetical protein GCM10011581_45980 [Saccharopolyspora subtropica]